jgi:predicted GNAT family N-acyltransferase
MFLNIGMFCYLVDIRFVIAEDVDTIVTCRCRITHLEEFFSLRLHLRVDGGGAANANERTRSQSVGRVVVAAKTRGAYAPRRVMDQAC